VKPLSIPSSDQLRGAHRGQTRSFSTASINSTASRSAICIALKM